MKKQLFLLLLLSPLLCISSQQSYIPSALQKDFHIANLVEKGERFDTIDEDTQKKILQDRLNSNKSESIDVAWCTRERRISKSELSCLTLQDIELIAKSNKRSLSKMELTRFTEFSDILLQSLRPNYQLYNPDSHYPEKNYRITFHYRKKITPGRIARKVFRLDRALFTQLSAFSILMYTHFITKPLWHSITGTQDPLALARNSELLRKNEILDQLVKQGTLCADDILKHTIEEVPFNYCWRDHLLFLGAIFPPSSITTLLHSINSDKWWYAYSNLYYDNGPKYHISRNNMDSIMTYCIFHILPHLLVHFNLTKPILLPLTEAIFEDRNMSGIALIAASLLTLRIFLAIGNAFQWKKKSIDFNNPEEKDTAQRLKIDHIDFSTFTVADCINKHLNNDDIIIW